MKQFVPLSMFEHDAQAVVVVDEQASVRLLNRAARRLLRFAPTRTAPDRCWLLFRFRAQDGSPFCGPDCPVQRCAREGNTGTRHMVVHRTPEAAEHMFEMISFVVPSTRDDRSGVLHLLRSLAETGGSSADVTPGKAGETWSQSFGLTGREHEVLVRLAEGFSTEAIAETLGISTTTVRNHVQSILHRMGVHRRIEAVVAYGRGVAPVPEP